MSGIAGLHPSQTAVSGSKHGRNIGTPAMEMWTHIRKILLRQSSQLRIDSHGFDDGEERLARLDSEPDERRPCDAGDEFDRSAAQEHVGMAVAGNADFGNG